MKNRKQLQAITELEILVSEADLLIGNAWEDCGLDELAYPVGINDKSAGLSEKRKKQILGVVNRFIYQGLKKITAAEKNQMVTDERDQLVALRVAAQAALDYLEKQEYENAYEVLGKAEKEFYRFHSMKVDE